jgi:hypothetical protein
MEAARLAELLQGLPHGSVIRKSLTGSLTILDKLDTPIGFIDLDGDGRLVIYKNLLETDLNHYQAQNPMTEEFRLKSTVTTKLSASLDLIEQEVTDFNGQITKKIVQLQDEQIRRALIAMGWTPPGMPREQKLDLQLLWWLGVGCRDELEKRERFLIASEAAQYAGVAGFSEHVAMKRLREVLYLGDGHAGCLGERGSLGTDFYQEESDEN